MFFFNIFMVQASLQDDMTKHHRKKMVILAIRDALKQERKNGGLWMNKSQFELSLANHLGVTLRKVQMYLSELQTMGYIYIDKENNEVILCQKLDTI